MGVLVCVERRIDVDKCINKQIVRSYVHVVFYFIVSTPNKIEGVGKGTRTRCRSFSASCTNNH